MNVLVGEPNCGKTNIVEALGLLWPWLLKSSKICLRAEGAVELFGNHDFGKSISVTLGEFSINLQQAEKGERLRLEYLKKPKGRAIFHLSNRKPPFIIDIDYYDGFRESDIKVLPFYFDSKIEYGGGSPNALDVPFGGNLPSLLLADKASREIAGNLFHGTGFTLQINVAEQSLSVSKSIDGLVFSFPYTASSETLRRILFYRLAVETNRDSILLFDEPEANTFPVFTKLFAERIAADDQENTFFLTTHSPYLLSSLIEKTPQEDLAVVLCHMEDFETKARVLEQSEVQELLDLGPSAFFNLDRFAGE